MMYADEFGYGDDVRDFLWDVIRQVDAAFMKIVTEQTKAPPKQ